MQTLTKPERQQVVKKLLDNEILILPTDTIYGLSLIAKNNEPALLNSLKKADLNKPVIMLIDKFSTIKPLVEADKLALKILKTRRPSTTVIFPLKDSTKTIAVRICKRKDIAKIIAQTGPIYSTSVNLSGQEPLGEYRDLVKFLRNEDNIYWVGKLNSTPSKIYNSITKSWER